MAIDENFISFHYIHHLFFSLEFILLFFFLLLISIFISFVPYSLTAHVHECLHAPLPSFAFLSLCFCFCIAFFLSYLFPIFSAWFILCDTLILLTILFILEIVKYPEEWGKLDHWRISVLLPGHMVFHSILKLEFFSPVVLIHVGVPGIPAPNLGIKVYYSDSFNISLSSWSYYFEEMNKQGEQNKQISVSLGWACWGHPRGFHRGRQIPTVNLYVNLAIGVAKCSVNVISLVTVEEGIIIFLLIHKLHEFEL